MFVGIYSHNSTSQDNKIMMTIVQNNSFFFEISISIKQICNNTKKLHVKISIKITQFVIMKFLSK